MSQTISATRSPTLRIDLFPPSGSRFDTENDYGFDDNTGRYVLGPTPSNVSEIQKKIDMYNAATEKIEPWGPLFEGKSAEHARSIIRTEVAFLRSQQMSYNAKASSRLRSRSRQVITDKKTKSVIDPLIKALVSHDPGASKVLRSVADAQDTYRGLNTNNPDDWPIMVKNHSQRIKDWVDWSLGQKTLSGPSRTPKDTVIGGSRASKTPETVVYAQDTEDQEDNGSQSEDEFDPNFKWTPPADFEALKAQYLMEARSGRSVAKGSEAGTTAPVKGKGKATSSRD